MVERQTTYIDPTFVALSQPIMIDGVTFRRYRTDNAQYAMISDDGQLMVKRGYLNSSFTAYVIGVGPMPGGRMPPKRFRDENRACSEAVALLKVIKDAQAL